MTYSLRISLEMKDREITGPMLDEIVGKALKDGGNVKDVVIICRRVNGGARAGARKHQARHNFRITFIEDET